MKSLLLALTLICGSAVFADSAQAQYRYYSYRPYAASYPYYSTYGSAYGYPSYGYNWQTPYYGGYPAANYTAPWYPRYGYGYMQGPVFSARQFGFATPF